MIAPLCNVYSTFPMFTITLFAILFILLYFLLIRTVVIYSLLSSFVLRLWNVVGLNGVVDRRMHGSYKVQWVLQTVSSNAALYVTLIYWTAVWVPGKFWVAK